MGPELPLERHHFTAADLARMVDAGILAEGAPIELIDGELIIVSPQGPSHIVAIQILAELLRKAYEGATHVRVQGPIQAAPDSQPEPDLAVARGGIRDYRARHPSGDELELVVEIARTSQILDRSKASLYARAGVPVYWLVDLAARRVEVYSEPSPALGAYSVTTILAETQSIQPPGRAESWPIAELLP